ncbi:hypothetical protein QCF18_10150 [Staphylococcus aureus]|jgi:DNA-binding transcriptional regulator GbsR (MarR family)|uniref:Phage protein n=25 Tax=Kayvirus TaxID=1857843 RepID=I6WAI6_9CAUD|nr:hypothetical protein [Staphylococcus aureus]YP_008873674.1 hypothetical protein X920_gp030 [Staphylococcus phage Sb1]YP_009098343.1 hypothetical protein QLX38_gp042 [Staphylococcus phage Team1]YP_009780184.1 hypothetical protein QLX23_gp123 [Staphylococcus phage ISP]YP_009780393.1 hypothetical protein QLX37_gp121 [Staphylococcus phage SA5]YP_009780677.1 hypothetical protein QLX29_gp203 [Staphylococcus phage Staph1N]YP_009780890.1 hypothetical protein QLX30_gp184 [Staphylococcus phage A3R]
MIIDKLNGVKLEIGGHVVSFSVRKFNTINGERQLIDYHHIKRNRQQYFRTTEEFYNEYKEIKPDKNEIDEMFESLGYVDTELDDVVRNQEKVTEILGVSEQYLNQLSYKAIEEYVDKVVTLEIKELKGEK